MTYWKFKPLCKINVKCDHNNIINNINPDFSNFDNLNRYIDFKKKYIIKNITNDDIYNLYIFLKNNYNFYYSIEVLKLIVFNPFTNNDFNLLLFDNNIMIGVILSIEKKLYIDNLYENAVNIVLLCIHKNYRGNKLACYLLDEVIKNIKQNNINIGLFNTTYYLDNIKYIKSSYLLKRPKTKSKINLKNIYLSKDDFVNTDNMFFHLNQEEIDYWFNNEKVKNYKYNSNIVSFLPIIYKDEFMYLLFYKNIKNIQSYYKLLLNVLPEYDIYIYNNNVINKKNIYIININYYYLYNYHIDNMTLENLII